MKNLIKKYVPDYFIAILRPYIAKQRAMKAYRYDRQRFLRYYARGDARTDSQTNVEAQVIFSTHQVEKGLSHVEFRDGFGKDALRDLRYGLERLTDHRSTVYLAALSSLKAYFDIHKERGYDISLQKEILGHELVKEVSECTDTSSGCLILDRDSKKNNKTKNFKELFENRYTIREYSDQKLDMNKINEAINIALKTPTVCNRQSFRIVVISNKEKIKQALSVQNGFRGYSYPPVLALVLTDTQAFRGITERNNLYIDGGSFMMSFLLGLEYVGLAACPLNTMFSIEEEKKTREILDISNNYNFISYVAIGNYRNKNKVAKSFRFSAEEVTIEIK